MEEVTEITSDDDEAEEDIETEISERVSEEDLQMTDNHTQSAQSTARVEQKEVNGKRPVSAARNKLTKKPKRRNADGIVQVMERFVQIKEKEVSQETTQKFSITKCMDALKTLDGLTPDVKLPALEVFKVADNREIFLNLVDDKDGSAITWLHAQIAKLT